jgi:hypothetical protein
MQNTKGATTSTSPLRSIEGGGAGTGEAAGINASTAPTKRSEPVWLTILWRIRLPLASTTKATLTMQASVFRVGLEVVEVSEQLIFP